MKFIIEITENYDIAKKILKGWQFFVYKKSARSLFKMIHSRLKAFDYKKVGDSYTYTEEGEKDYILLQKRKFEAFMFADSSELTKTQYAKIANDRFIQKVYKGAHKLKDRIKDKAMRSAMLGGHVLGFFTNLGIFIKWRVEKENFK